MDHAADPSHPRYRSLLMRHRLEVAAKKGQWEKHVQHLNHLKNVCVCCFGKYFFHYKVNEKGEKKVPLEREEPSEDLFLQEGTTVTSTTKRDMDFWVRIPHLEVQLSNSGPKMGIRDGIS